MNLTIILPTSTFEKYKTLGDIEILKVVEFDLRKTTGYHTTKYTF